MPIVSINDGILTIFRRVHPIKIIGLICIEMYPPRTVILGLLVTKYILHTNTLAHKRNLSKSFFKYLLGTASHTKKYWPLILRYERRITGHYFLG